MDVWKQREAEKAAQLNQPALGLERRRSAAVEALSKRTSLSMPAGGLQTLLEEVEEHHAERGKAQVPEARRNEALQRLMSRKTLLSDDRHEQVDLVNGHLVRAGDTTHHTSLSPMDGDESSDEGAPRRSVTRFDPEVRPIHAPSTSDDLFSPSLLLPFSCFFSFFFF